MPCVRNGNVAAAAAAGAARPDGKCGPRELKYTVAVCVV